MALTSIEEFRGEHGNVIGESHGEKGHAREG